MNTKSWRVSSIFVFTASDCVFEMMHENILWMYYIIKFGILIEIMFTQLVKVLRLIRWTPTKLFWYKYCCVHIDSAEIPKFILIILLYHHNRLKVFLFFSFPSLFDVIYLNNNRVEIILLGILNCLYKDDLHKKKINSLTTFNTP